MKRTRNPSDDSLRCSFCHKSANSVGKLISSPSDYPRAYICDECIAVCTSIIEDDQPEPLPSNGVPTADSPHPLLDHPLASRLLATIEDWIREDSLGKNASAALADVRAIASQMVSGGR